MPKNGNIHPTRIFKTPDDLKEAWDKFKVDLKEQSKEWVKYQYVGRDGVTKHCLLYTSPSPRDRTRSRMPSSA